MSNFLTVHGYLGSRFLVRVELGFQFCISTQGFVVRDNLTT